LLAIHLICCSCIIDVTYILLISPVIMLFMLNLSPFLMTSSHKTTQNYNTWIGDKGQQSKIKFQTLFFSSTSTMPRRWVVKNAMGIEFTSLYDFSIIFLNCSNSVVVCVFSFYYTVLESFKECKVWVKRSSFFHCSVLFMVLVGTHRHV